MAANYRAACLARSHAEFTSTIGTVLIEADESFFWLEDLAATAGTSRELQDLINEAEQLTKIFGASYRTAKQGRGKRRARDQ